MSLEDIVSKISTSKDIPTIGPIASEVMRLASDSDADFGKMSKLIEKDVALTARVLKVANSGYYGIRGDVSGVDRAVALLGLAEVRNIALSVSVISDFTGRFGSSAFDWEKFWEHSSGCALIAQVFARLVKLKTNGDEYVAGLLHDVGKIILGHHYPNDFAQALELAAEKRISLADAESIVFGADHAQVGAWVAEHWGFPAPLRNSIRLHHTPEMIPQGEFLPAVVRLADLFAKAKCIGYGGDDVPVCLADDPAWSVLSSVSSHLGSLDVEKLTYRLDREVDAAREMFKMSRRA